MRSQIIDVTAPLHVIGAFARGDKDVAQTFDIVQNIGDSPIDIMSQQAVTKAISDGIVFEFYNKKQIDEKDTIVLNKALAAIGDIDNGLEEYDPIIRKYIDDSVNNVEVECKNSAHLQDLYYSEKTLNEAKAYVDKMNTDIIPTVDMEYIPGGVEITITDAFGEHSANVYNGPKGDPGDPFTIAHVYTSYDEMVDDIANIKDGEFSIINTGDVEDEDTGKLYLKTNGVLTFIVDISGMQGFSGKTPVIEMGNVTTGTISDATLLYNGTDSNGNPKYLLNLILQKGDKGDQGIPGPKGNPFTYADFTQEQLAALVGPPGEEGRPGQTGSKGDPGPKGEPGRSPIIQTGTWWIYDNDLNQYVDTGVSLNSDYILTKDKVEAVLTGDITSHNHDSSYLKDAPTTGGQYVRQNGAWNEVTIPDTSIYVVKETGKGLSTNDYTTEDKTKLEGIEAGAQVNTVTSVVGKTGAITLLKTDVNLGNVDNTSDLNKPISTATKSYVDNAISTIPTPDVSGQISVHNDSATAHSDIRALISNTYTKSEVDNAIAEIPTPDVSGQIAEHNTSDTAHADIRTAITNITNSKGLANGIASLDSTGKVPSAQLPSYVDDVIEFDTKSLFPTIGEDGKIYIDKSTNLTWRWTGTTYVEISPSLALGETSSTAYAGDKGKAVTDKVNLMYTNAQIDTKLSTKADTTLIPTKVSQLTNDSNYVITTDERLSNARPASDVSAWAKASVKPTYTASEVGALPSTTIIPTDNNQLANGAGYTTQSWVQSQGYLTQHQDISGKVDKIEGKSLSTNDFTNAYKSQLDRLTGVNKINTLTLLPVNKRSIIATLSTATDLTLLVDMNIGEEVIIRCVPTANFTQPIPTTGSWSSLSGSSFDATSGVIFEMSIWCYDYQLYAIVIKETE